MFEPVLPIKIITEDKAAFVRPVLDRLPDWFGIYEATEHYITSAESLDLLGCEDESGPVGVLSIRRHFEKTYEIDVMAIVPRWHRKGLGRRLIDEACDHVRSQGASMLTVKTLGASHPDKNYAATRAFYLSVGFLPLEEFMGLWGSGNPCLFMVKPVL